MTLPCTAADVLYDGVTSEVECRPDVPQRVGFRGWPTVAWPGLSSVTTATVHPHVQGC